MGGSAILNPEGRYYQHLKSAFEADCEGNYWAEDIIFMERNSRDFVIRMERINDNAEAICNRLGKNTRGIDTTIDSIRYFSGIVRIDTYRYLIDSYP